MPILLVLRHIFQTCGSRSQGFLDCFRDRNVGFYDVSVVYGYAARLFEDVCLELEFIYNLVHRLLRDIHIFVGQNLFSPFGNHALVKYLL